MQVCIRSRVLIERWASGKPVPISECNYIFIIEIIRTARSTIPAKHHRKTGISVPPYVFILKGKNHENFHSFTDISKITCSKEKM